MTKLRNKLVLVLLALCIVACLGFLTIACGGDEKPEDKSVAYTVTVTAGGAAAEGVNVTVKKGGATLGTPKATDKAGKVEFKLAKADGYSVTLANLPAGYELPADATLTFGASNKLTISLVEKFAYTVKLVNPDGTAFTAAGVKVGICKLDENCLSPVEIGADGVAKIYDAEKTDYHVQILDLPAGYAYESDDHGYSAHQTAEGTYIWEGKDNTYNNLSETVVTQEIKIYPVNVIELKDEGKLSNEKLNEYKQSLYIEGSAVYGMEIKVPAKTTAYYAYTAEYSGNYCLASTNANLSYKLNPVFLLGDTVWKGNGIFVPIVQMTKGEVYYLNITNGGDEEQTATLLMGTPTADIITVNGATTVEANIYAKGINAVIEFAPPKGTSYKLTVDGEGAIKQADSVSTAQNASFSDDDYKVKELAVKYTEDMTERVYIAVSAKSDKAATVKVKIEKTGENKNTTVVVANDKITKAPAPVEGKEFVALTADEAGKLVKGDDGYYHVGTKDGALVMVVLTKSVGKYVSGIIYSELDKAAPNIPYVVDATSDADKADPKKGKTFNDYRFVLRGFDDYKVIQAQTPSPDGNKYEIPTDITVDKYYANPNYINSDGAYPLDDTLKEFLTYATATLSNEWYFACGYYGEPRQADAIVGVYTTADKAYTLTINKDGNFAIHNAEDFDDFNMEEGTWSKTGNTYTFVCNGAEVYGSQLTYAAGKFTFVDDLGTNITFNGGNEQSGGDGKLEAELYTDESMAKLELYEKNTFKFYFHPSADSSEWVVWVYAKITGGTQENPQLQIIEKNDLITDVKFRMEAVPGTKASKVIVELEFGPGNLSTLEFIWGEVGGGNEPGDDEPGGDDGKLKAELYTDESMAKLELYEKDTFKFYFAASPDDDVAWTLWAYAKFIGGTSTNPELQIIEKHEAVTNVKFRMEKISGSKASMITITLEYGPEYSNDIVFIWGEVGGGNEPGDGDGKLLATVMETNNESKLELYERAFKFYLVSEDSDPPLLFVYAQYTGGTQANPDLKIIYKYDAVADVDISFIQAVDSQDTNITVWITYDNDFRLDYHYVLQPGSGDNEQDVVIGKYEEVLPMGTKTLIVNVDYSYTITINDNTLNGGWVKVDEDKYEFTEYNEALGDFTYAVFLNENTLEFFEDPDDYETPAAYTFTRVVEQTVTPQTTLYSKNEINGMVIGKLELYEDGTCIFYKSMRGMMQKTAEATYTADEEGNVTINVTKVDSELADEVTATCSDGVITVVVKQEEFDDTAYVFGMLRSSLLTATEDAKFEMYADGSYEFYLKEGGEYVSYVYGKITDFEEFEIAVISKVDSVDTAQTALSMGDGDEGNDVAIITFKITYTDETEAEYVFQMSAEA